MLITDSEADRQLSLRVASSLPLPPEISMMNERDARYFHRWAEFYDVFGVIDHPVVQMLSKHRRQAAMATAISKAPYLERASHLNAWLSGDKIRIFDLAGGDNMLFCR